MEHQPGRVLDRECARAGQRGEVTKAVAEKDGRPRLAALDDPVTGQRQRERGHVGVLGVVAGQPHGLTAHGLTAHGLTAHGLTAHGLTAHGLTAQAAASAEAGIEAEFRRGHLVYPLEDIGGFRAAQLMLKLLPGVTGMTRKQQHVTHGRAPGPSS